MSAEQVSPVRHPQSAAATPLRDLSIVVPAYNEEVNLPVLRREVAAVLEAAGLTFEFVFVDDGSRDSTAEVIRQLARESDNVRGVLLSRNFGHQPAVSIGLQYAHARAIAVMDADLQDRPVDLLTLYEKWKEGVDVAYAVRASRKENFFKRLAYRAFYRLLAYMARIPIPLDSGDFCVMDARFVAKLNDLPERLRFVRGLRAWLGGKQVAVAVPRDPRRAGEPQYTFWKLVRLAVDGLISFSDAPLRLASFLGFTISTFAFAGTIVVMAWKILGLLPTGASVATITLSVLFLGGVQLVTVGVLGEYIGRIFDEVKRRPIAVVQEVVESEQLR